MIIERLVVGLRNQWSWALPAFVRGALRLRRGDIELVYTSGGAYSAHLAGYWLKRWCGVRWIVEVHDPLVFPERPLRNRDDRFQARLEEVQQAMPKRGARRASTGQSRLQDMN